MLEFLKEERELKDISQKYVIKLKPQDELWAADNMMELVAAICGSTYVDAEWEETKWHMRRETAVNAGLYLITAMEADMGFPDKDEFEPIIVYDERIGKIPWNYTDPIIDYDIHGAPELIRIECEESFVYSLLKLGLIQICEVRENRTKMVNLGELYDIDQLLDESIEPFRHIDERVPLHKKLGE